MSDTVISVENVSKYYRLGLIGGGTLRADCERWWARARGKPDPTRKIDQRSNVPTLEGSNEIWALRDVSFQVQQGEVLGIPFGKAQGKLFDTAQDRHRPQRRGQEHAPFGGAQGEAEEPLPHYRADQRRFCGRIIEVHMKNFAITGVAGYIAPRHLKAIKDTGNRLIAAVDPHDSVGLLDGYSFDTRFFTEIERFDRHLEKLRRGPPENWVHFVSVCSPNYLHDAHCRLAMRVGADVICEKPLVINPWNLDALQELESELGRRINTVLQLRLHPSLIQLREALQSEGRNLQHDVRLTYVTARGGWYHTSWKGSAEKSGGIATNIGIHFFDLLLWLFGPAGDLRVYHADPQRMAGFLELARARVMWFLSIDHADLPFPAEPGGRTTYRSITVDGQEIEFTEGFTGLHTRVYEAALAGHGFGIEDARPSIDLVYRIRNAPLSPLDDMAHPFLTRR